MTIASSSEESCLFLNYIISLTSADKVYLISKPACALFIFRMLPNVAQQVVIKLIWNCNVSTSMIQEQLKHQIDESKKLLLSLELVTSDQHGCIYIQRLFRYSYLRAVMVGTQRCANMPSVSVEEKKRQKDVGKKASERWECILRYLALPSEKNMQSVSSATRKLFRNAGFTSGNDSQSDLEITSSGFQFLLLSPVQQMWTYMIEYLKLEVSENQDVRGLLEILIRIILCIDRGNDPSHTAYQLGEDWTERQNELIMHMRELGLIFIRKRKDGVFFLTPLMWNLSTGSEEVGRNENKHGNIIVETNFRLYAYTSSSLQLAILSTFTEMIYRFHDMSVGILTRDSVRRALQVGISAAQIISFLRSNAHPQCLSSGGPLNCLPVTVADQIRLWEDERRRLTFSEATLYSTFESENEFIGVRNFSSDESILLWADSDKKLVIVTEEGHDKVRVWWKRNKGSVS